MILTIEVRYLDHIIPTFAHLLEQGTFTLDDLAERIDEVYCNPVAQYEAELLRDYVGIITKQWKSGVTWSAERKIEERNRE